MNNSIFPVVHRATFMAALGLFVVSMTAIAIAQEQAREPKQADGVLQWKFKAGQKLKMEMDQNQTISMNIAGTDIETKTTTTSEIMMDVKSVDDSGVATMTNTINRMKVETVAPQITISYDTASEEEPTGPALMIAKIMKPMIGKEMKQKMRPSGKVFDVDVPDAMLAGIKEAGPMMAQMMNKKTIEEMSTKASLEFPKSDMMIGETWNIKADMNMGGSTVISDTAYTYMGVVDVDGQPLHVVEGTIKMSFPDGISGVDVEVDKEDTTAKFYFDGVAGRISKSTLDQDMTMILQTGGQKINQRLVQKMDIKLTEVE